MASARHQRAGAASSSRPTTRQLDASALALAARCSCANRRPAGRGRRAVIFLDIDFSPVTAAADDRWPRRSPCRRRRRAPRLVNTRPPAARRRRRWSRGAPGFRAMPGSRRQVRDDTVASCEAAHGVMLDGLVVQSVAALLAGEPEPRAASFGIDFSISPASVPVFSVSVLLSGRVPAVALPSSSSSAPLPPNERQSSPSPSTACSAGRCAYSRRRDDSRRTACPPPRPRPMRSSSPASCAVDPHQPVHPPPSFRLAAAAASGLTAARSKGGLLPEHHIRSLPTRASSSCLRPACCLPLRAFDIGPLARSTRPARKPQFADGVRSVIDDSVDRRRRPRPRGSPVRVSRSAKRSSAQASTATSADFSRRRRCRAGRTRTGAAGKGSAPVGFELELREAGRAAISRPRCRVALETATRPRTREVPYVPA